MKPSIDEVRDWKDEAGNKADSEEKVWYHKGEVLSQSGRYREAIECYNEAVQLAPKFEEAWFRIGELLMKLDELEKAEECFSWILEVNPDNMKAKKALLTLAEDKENIDGKSHNLQSASQKGVRKARLHRIRIRKVRSSGKTIEDYDSQENAPQEEDLSTSYDDFDTKLDELQQLLIEKTDQSDAGDAKNIQPGEVHIDARNAEDTQRDEDEVSIESLVIEGEKHMQIKEFEKALGYFNRALELDPLYLDAWSTKGNLLWEAGQDKDPIKNLVIEGKKHMQIKEFDKALICFDLALVLDPQHLDAWSAKGNLLRETTKIKNQ